MSELQFLTLTQRGRSLWSVLLVATLCLLSLGGHVRAQDATGTPPPPLAEQVGFSDSTLSQLEASGQSILGDSVQFNAYGHAYRLLAVWEKMDGLDFPISGTALLYQTDGGAPKLVWHVDYSQPWGQAPYISSAVGGTFNAPAPSDWNADGKTEFGVIGSFAGTAWYSTMLYVYQLQPDGSVVDLLANQIPAGYIAVAAESDLNGGVLLTVADVSGEMAMGLANCCGPHASRYFTWRDGQLVDVSAERPDKYMYALGYAVYTVTTQDIPDGAEFSARLLEILEMYQAIGQKDAGWALVQTLVAQAKESGRLQSGTYVDTTFLPTMKQLYDAGKPFIVPDYVGPDATAVPPDFYASSGS